MLIGEFIKNYRTSNKISMDDFAEYSGLSKAYISMLEKNKNSKNGKPIVPSPETILKVAKVLGMTFDELFGKLDKSQQVYIGQLPDIERIEIPTGANAVTINVYSSVHAGFPEEAQGDIVDQIEIPASWTKGGQEYIGIKVKGDCMEPRYLEDDTVIVKIQTDCESGQDVIVYVNGFESQLRKVIKKEDSIILQPLNPNYEPHIYGYDDTEYPVVIVGVVVQIRRDV